MSGEVESSDNHRRQTKPAVGSVLVGLEVNALRSGTLMRGAMAKNEDRASSAYFAFCCVWMWQRAARHDTDVFGKNDDIADSRAQELNRDRQELIVIGQVIGTQSERVVQALEKADIDCMVQGDEFHDISVPMHRRQEAVGIVAKDAQQGGYEIIWKTQ